MSVPGVVTDLISTGSELLVINISWSPPIVSNGIITVYEIQYNDALSNTTKTVYSIEGLIPNTNYTIRVRAYTIVGPGEWSNILMISTTVIRKYMYLCLNLFIHTAIIMDFSVIQHNFTDVQVTWSPITTITRTEYQYILHYSSESCLIFSGGNRQFIPSDTDSIVLGGLDLSNLTYKFSISLNIISTLNDRMYEGNRSHYIKISGNYY